MKKIATLPFRFREKEYYLLIKISTSGDSTDYYVTAITDAKSKLYGQYHFRKFGSSLKLLKSPVENGTVSDLKEKIHAALKDFLAEEA